VKLRDEALDEIEATRKFFDRTTRCLTEADSGFRPSPGTWSVASQVAHAAFTLDWFREGVFDGRWDMEFDRQIAEASTATSLDAERRKLADAWRRLRERVEAATDEELEAPMADNPILGARPRYHLMSAVTDHTAHHRGSLAVYARLLGRVPDMPYGDD
jgi:uncharacterized damage-inducible protein DinB